MASSLGGDAKNHLSNTVIRDCEISNVRANDCITLHKDKYQNDIGKHHLIENNVLHHCGGTGTGYYVRYANYRQK